MSEPPQAKQFTLELWADYGCFTRPETKVERFSYPVITPSSIRNILDSIYIEFDKATERPAHRWEVSRIELLSAVRYVSLMRNEVKDKVSVRDVKRWMRDPGDWAPLYADATRAEIGTDQKGRTQRQTMALKAPHYRITAHTVLYREDPRLRNKIEQSFERRAKRGQCIYQPYFGCREFSAFFELVGVQESGAPHARILQPEYLTLAPVEHTEEVGWMLYDVFDLSAPNGKNADPHISLFNAKIKNGVLKVPPYLNDAVRKPPPKPAPKSTSKSRKRTGKARKT